MNYLLDDVAQILAGPTSRRQTLRLLGRALVGTMAGTFWLGVTPAPAGQVRPAKVECTGVPGECTDPKKPICCCKGTNNAKCAAKCNASPSC
jgi:hypothetical protein